MSFFYFEGTCEMMKLTIWTILHILIKNSEHDITEKVNKSIAFRCMYLLKKSFHLQSVKICRILQILYKFHEHITIDVTDVLFKYLSQEQEEI